MKVVLVAHIAIYTLKCHVYVIVAKIYQKCENYC